MSNATDYLESSIGDALFVGGVLNITQWTVHLYSSAPAENGGGGSEVAAGANGYQPVRCDPGAGNWSKAAAQDASGNTLYRNLVPIQFPTVVTSWGGVNYVGLKNQNGQLCFIAPLTVQKNFAVGDAPVFLTGELEFAIG